MLNRMQEAMDNILQQEQAGFHKGRSCCEQIFTPNRRKSTGMVNRLVLCRWCGTDRWFSWWSASNDGLSRLLGQESGTFYKCCKNEVDGSWQFKQWKWTDDDELWTRGTFYNIRNAVITSFDDWWPGVLRCCSARLEQLAIQRHCVTDTRDLQASAEDTSFRCFPYLTDLYWMVWYTRV